MKNARLRIAVCEILESLEYNTEKEESFVNTLLSKFKMARMASVESLSKEVSAKIEGQEISFEDFFAEILNYFRPFSLMIEEIYKFLNSYSVTINSRASQFRFNFEKLQEKLSFDISNFPMELIRSFSHKETRLFKAYDVNLAAKGDYDDGLHGKEALQFISLYDGDFYQQFLTPVSYFWVFKEKSNSLFIEEFALIEKDIDSVIEDVKFLVDSCFTLFHLESEQIDMSFFGELQGNVAEFDERHNLMKLKNGFRPNENDRARLCSDYGNRNIFYDLNSLALAVQFWQSKYVRTDLSRNNWAFQNPTLEECLKNPRTYIDLMKKQMVKFERALYDILIVKAARGIEEVVDDILAFVRLPYWKYRWHIFELWTLVLCLDIAKSLYSLKLSLKDHSDYLELMIPKAIAKEPVASITSNQKEIGCWFQRKTIDPRTGEGLEPDLRFMTKDTYPTDIFVIENKDRRNCSGSHVNTVREKYVSGTIAKNIWIVNYEKYRKKEFSEKLSKTTIEDRNVWIASNFKPTEVPREFYLNFLSMLEDYFGSSTQGGESSYDLVVDKSGSMEHKPVLDTVETIFGNFGYEPKNIYLFDDELIEFKPNNIEELKKFVSNTHVFKGGTKLVYCFEDYLQSKSELPKMAYIVTDGDGLDECYEKYHLETLKKGCSLIFVKI